MPPARHLQQRTAYHGAKLWNAFGPVVYFGRARTRGRLALGLDSDQAPRCAPTPPPHFALAWKSSKGAQQTRSARGACLGGLWACGHVCESDTENVRLAGPKIGDGRREGEADRDLVRLHQCVPWRRRAAITATPLTYDVFSERRLPLVLPSFCPTPHTHRTHSPSLPCTPPAPRTPSV